MTVSSAEEMWSRRSSTSSTTDGLNRKAGFSSAYSIVHSYDTDMPEIMSTTLIPKEGDVRTGTSNVYCKKRSFSQVSPIMTIATIEWEGEFGPLGVSDDPLNKEPEIVWSNSTANEPIDEDYNGIPITNVNGEFVEGLTAEINDFVLRVNRNYASVNTYLTSQYLKSVNSDVFAGWPPGTAKLKSFSAKEVRTANPYFEVSAEIHFRVPYRTVPARAWWKRYRNEGFYERKGVVVEIDAPDDPDGEQAAAYPVVSSGTIISIIVTNQGSGYDPANPPAVTITSPYGTGATASPVLLPIPGWEGDFNSYIDSISVTAAGTNYREKFVRMLDDHDEPVVKPFLLKANGTRERNANNAIWIERPIFGYLPFNALGLI